MTVEKQIQHITNIVKSIKQMTMDELADQRLVEVLEVIESYTGELKNILTKRINTAKQLADVRKDELTLHSRWDKTAEMDIWSIIDKLTDISNNNETIADLVKKNGVDVKPTEQINTVPTEPNTDNIIEITDTNGATFYITALPFGMEFGYTSNLTTKKSKAMILSSSDVNNAKNVLSDYMNKPYNKIIRNFTIVPIDKAIAPLYKDNVINVKYMDGCFYWIKIMPTGNKLSLEHLTKIKKNAQLMNNTEAKINLKYITDNHMPTDVHIATIEQR